MKNQQIKILRLIISAILALTWLGECRASENQNIELLLQQFQHEPTATTANNFMDELLKEDFLDETIHFPNQTNVDSLRQQVFYWAAEWLYFQQQYKTAEQYASKALSLFNFDNDNRADCLNLLGIIYVRLGDFTKATEYAKQCLEIDIKSGDSNRIASSMNTIAGIYMAGYQAVEAEKYILGALKHSEQINNPERRAVILGMASEVYHSLGDDNKALSYAHQAYCIDSLLGREPQTSIRLSQKGTALLGLHRCNEAEKLFLSILSKLKNAGNYHSYAITLNKLGMALLCQQRQNEAIPYFDEAVKIFSKMNDLYNEIHSYKGLYESYWNINPDSAKWALDRFNKLKDSLYTHSTAETLSRYNAEFGNNQLRQKILRCDKLIALQSFSVCWQ